MSPDGPVMCFQCVPRCDDAFKGLASATAAYPSALILPFLAALQTAPRSPPHFGCAPSLGVPRLLGTASHFVSTICLSWTPFKCCLKTICCRGLSRCSFPGPFFPRLPILACLHWTFLSPCVEAFTVPHSLRCLSYCVSLSCPTGANAELIEISGKIPK